MSLWVDKYRPKDLSKIDYHYDISDRLKSLASSGDFPHLLVYGPSGAGKKTRILATLKELYGSGVSKMKIDVRVFKVPNTSRKIEFNIVSSPFHIEITPSDLGNNDRIIIQDLLKEIGQTEQAMFNKGKFKFKIVVINEADSLSRDAQAALRRTMEKYSTNIRLILISNSTSNIIAPIKSRTLLIRVSLPTISEIHTVLNRIVENENIILDSNDKAVIFDRIANASERNLRRSILTLEALVMTSSSPSSLDANSQIVELDWEVVLNNLTNSIIKDRTVKNLSMIRSVLYELLSHCIPDKVVLKKICFNLLNDFRVNEAQKCNIIECCSVFDERLSLGSKSIFHLEGFIAKVMVILETL